MGKVKAALAAIKKQHFWVLCGLIVILAVVAWKIAIASVSQQFDTRKTELEGHLSKVQGIKNDTEHPNQATIDNLDVQAGQLSEEVFGVWEELYRNQQKLNPWPEELGPEFIAMVNSLPEDQDFPRAKYNENYQMFIANHLHHLDEIIDRRHLVELEAEGDAKAPNAMGGMGVEGVRTRRPMEDVGVLEWDDSNRASVRARFNWDTRPSTTRIRVAQEDLWIYEALLRVIAETNEGATGNFNAAVKRIDYLNIGKATGGLSQGSQRLGGTGTGGMGMGWGMGMGGAGMDRNLMQSMGNAPRGSDDMSGGGLGMGGMGRGMGMGGAGTDGMVDDAASEKARLTDGRYVDQDGKPLPAEAEHPYAEFKMMPIKLGVLVSQGKISDLLVNCANCTMPIDVRRVTLWSKGKGTVGVNSGGGFSGGMGMGGMGMGGMGIGGMGIGSMGIGGMGIGGMGNEGMDIRGGSFGGVMGSRGGATGTRRELITLATQKDIPVELEGVIYIFNKPAREKMGTGTEEGAATPSLLGSEPATEPGSMPAAPAETTPAEAPETTPANPTPPPVNATPPAGPAVEATPAAAGAGGVQPATTQPTAGGEPVTP